MQRARSGIVDKAGSLSYDHEECWGIGLTAAIVNSALVEASPKWYFYTKRQCSGSQNGWKQKQKQQQWNINKSESQKQKTADNNCWRYYTENGEHNVVLSNNMHYQ